MDKQTENVFSVEEAKTYLYSELAKVTEWKYLKSQNCLKKTVNDLVFEIDFYSSKWNVSYENVEVNAEFRLWCKTYGKTCNVNSIVGHMSYKPEDNYWYDISTSDKLGNTLEELRNKITETALDLCVQFENDYMGTVNKLLDLEFEKYNIYLDFIADKLGILAIEDKAREIYDNTSDVVKQQIIDYKNGSKYKTWMLNRCNLKYIVDNNLVYII